MTDGPGTARRTTVVVPTSKGPSLVLDLMEEIPNPGRSTACIGETTIQAGIGSAYNDFVKSPPGIVHRLFGLASFPSYRLSVSDPVEVGFSWQLPVLLAHALLQDGGRLAAPGSAGAGLVWATGAVSPVDYGVGSVGHVAEKLRSSKDLFLRALAEGHGVRILVPVGNVADVDPDTAAWLEGNGLRVEGVAEADEAFRMLGLPPVPNAASRKEAPAAPAWKGNPYRGLEPFLREHAPVFFGRTKAREEAAEVLATGAARGRPFLLIHGRSGVGKSSLVHAGLVPDVTGAARPGGPTRTAAIRPGGDPCASLAAGLGILLGRDHAETDAAGLVAALEAGASGPPALLVVDQIEELFDPAVGREEADAFCVFLERACRSRTLWVVATMRSDAMGSIGRFPALARLSAPERVLRLDPPSQFELCEIIAAPAALAGRPFADRAVPERLAAVAAASPDSLPLLQALLFRLHEASGAKDGAMLDRMGGFEGVVGRWAEDVREGIVADGVPEAAVDAVLTGLIRIDPETRRPMSRPMPLDDAEGPEGSDVLARTLLEILGPEAGELAGTRSTGADPEARRRIVDALVAGRIVSTSDGADGPRARLAHEVLVLHWPHLAALAEKLGEAIRIRDDVQERAAAWVRSGRSDADLGRDLGRLSRTAAALLSGGVDLGPDTAGYLSRSLRSAVEEKMREEEAEAFKEAVRLREVRRAKRGLRISAAVACVLAAAAWTSWRGWTFAFEQVADLERTSAVAVEQRRTAETNLSRFVAARAGAVAAETPLLAEQALLTVLPDGNDGRTIPTETGDALARAWNADGFLFGLRDEQKNRPTMWFDGGQRLLRLTSGPEATETDVSTGARIATRRLAGGHPRVSKAAADARTGRIAVVAGNGTIRSWTDFGKGPDWTKERPAGRRNPEWLSFDPTGSRLLVSYREGPVDILDARTGRPTASFAGAPPRRTTQAEKGLESDVDEGVAEFGSAVLDGGFDTSGKLLATVTRDGEATIRLAADASETLRFRPFGDISAAALSPDGRTLAMGTPEGDIGLVALDEAERFSSDPYLVPVFAPPVRVHSGPVSGLAWSPDGSRLLSVSDRDGIAVASASDPMRRSSIPAQGFPIRQASWSPDGTRILGETRDGFRVWRAPPADVPAPVAGFSGPADVLVADHARTRVITVDSSGSATIRSTVEPAMPVLGRLDGVTVLSARWSPDDRRLLVDTGDGLCVYEVAGTERVDCTDDMVALPVYAWSPDGRRYAFGGHGEAVRIRDVAAAGTTSTLTGPAVATMVTGLAWSPAGDRLAVEHLGGLIVVSVADGGTVAMAERDGDAILSYSSEDLSPGSALSWSRDGRRILWTRSTARAYVVDASTGRMTKTSDQKDQLRDASWDASGSRFLTTSWSGRIRIFDSETLSLLRTFEPPEPAGTAAWTAAGRIVVGPKPGVLDAADVRTLSELTDVVRFGVSSATSFADGPFADLDVRNGPVAAAPTDACDAEAGDLYDLTMPGRGADRIAYLDSRISWASLRPPALEPCLEAVAAHPDEPRYLYALSRLQKWKDMDAEALETLRRAADAGHAMALFTLAWRTEQREGVREDPAAARSLYVRARDAGALPAWERLGYMESVGTGGPRDPIAAEATWKRGAEAGDPGSNARLGRLAELGGPGRPADPAAALRYWATAAELFERYRDVERLHGGVLARRAALARTANPSIVAAVAREIREMRRLKGEQTSAVEKDGSGIREFLRGLFRKIGIGLS